MTFVCQEVNGWNYVYIHIRGAFSVARFGQTGQCEGLRIVERVTGLAPRFLYLYANNLSINRQEGAIGKIMIKHEKTIYFEINARLSLGSNEHGD